MNPIVLPLQAARLHMQALFRTIPRLYKSEPRGDDTMKDADPPTAELTSEQKEQVDERESGCAHPEMAVYEIFRDGLPMELWFAIVRHALEPRFALMHEFLPQDIQFFYTSLIIHSFSCPDRTEINRTKAALMLVCKDFNTIVKRVTDGNKQNPAWIWTYSPDNAPKYGPCARLDTNFRCLNDISKIKKQYLHDVRTISIHVEWGNHTESTPTLSSLLASPWTLKVLHISVPGSIELSPEFPLSVLSGLPSLQTLSIAAKSPFRFSGTLSMPQIKTLFLTCAPGLRSDMSQWSFPNLRNLAIDTRGWPRRSDNASNMFEQLIRIHRRTIRSLRILPLTHTSFSPLSKWTSLPHLEALATDVVRYGPVKNATVLHLIHISTHPYTWTQLSRGLLEALKSMPSLRTLAITEDPFLDAENAQVDEGELVTVGEVEEICCSREIKLIGKIGSDVCCVSKAYHELVYPRT